ncbi:ribonuclease III, partial [Plenodomus tracheiphilus IPT5]
QTIRNVETKVSDCERIIDYTVKSKKHILEALNASRCLISYANTTHSVPNNSALAVLGDARMAGVLCKWWWNKSITAQKDHWTQIRHDKCGNGALARLGQSLDLHECIITNPGAQVVSDKMIATAIEALFGAVYLDGGEEELERVMRVLGFDQHRYL